MVSVKLIHTVLRHVLSVLFPERCFKCGARGALLCEKCVNTLLRYRPRCVRCARDMCGGGAQNTTGVPEGSALCVFCKTHASPSRLPCDEIIVAQSYRTPPIQKAVRALKYHSAATLQETLAGLLWKKSAFAFDGMVSDNAVIVPVPISAQRLRRRGFNQSALLASAIARRATLPFIDQALMKIRHTKPQSETPRRSARIANMRGAFAVYRPETIRGKTVIIVDDVITTGATIIEASRALKHAGARRIIALVLAQS